MGGNPFAGSKFGIQGLGNPFAGSRFGIQGLGNPFAGSRFGIQGLGVEVWAWDLGRIDDDVGDARPHEEVQKRLQCIINGSKHRIQRRVRV